MGMLDELLAMMSPEERIAEFGTVEQKRAYIKEARAKDPNWVNTIFPSGKTKRDANWTACHRGQASAYMNITEGHWQTRGRRNLNHAARFGARPGRSRKARAH